jgi:heat-inducible transcriptional repressor
MIRHQFGQVEFASEHWFRLAAATLAGATHAAGLATPAKPRACRVRRVDIIPNSARTGNLVVVLADGPVKQALIPLDDQEGPELLRSAAQLLNEQLAGCSARQVAARVEAFRRSAEIPRIAIRAAERVERLIRDFDAAAVEDVFSDGLLNVMAAPEFAHSEKIRRVFGLLQDRDYVGGLVRRVANHDDVQVLIGAENEPDELRDVSLVLAGYGRRGGAMGVVGVLGPTRMSYPHAISSVRYVSGLMNELVEQLYR